MALTQHPLSAAFPSMSDADFQALKDDIENNGQREPVIVLDGMVLDGWHRYRACVDLGIKATQFTYSEGDPVGFVLSHNLHRRHLSASQRAAAVVACNSWAPAHRTKKVEPSSTLSKTNAELAKTANVTPRTITDAKAAHKAGLTDAVKQGAMTAKEAAAVARGKPAEAPSKPATKPKRTLDERPTEVQAVTDNDQFAEAQNTINELAQENEQLRDKLAVEAMDTSETGKTQAAETIKELRSLVKSLEAELDAVKKARNTLMVENGELKKQVASWRKKAEKVAA